MDASHSEWSVYVVSGYLWGAGTIQGAGSTAIPAIYPTNWTRKLAKMRANGVIEFPLFVRARSIELSNIRVQSNVFETIDGCFIYWRWFLTDVPRDYESSQKKKKKGRYRYDLLLKS